MVPWDCYACKNNPGMCAFHIHSSTLPFKRVIDLFSTGMQNITVVSDFVTQANGYVGYNADQKYDPVYFQMFYVDNR